MLARLLVLALTQAPSSTSSGPARAPLIARAPGGARVVYRVTFHFNDCRNMPANADCTWGSAELERSADGGASWSSPRRLEVPGVPERLEVETGEVLVVTMSDTGGGPLSYVSQDRGATWIFRPNHP